MGISWVIFKRQKDAGKVDNAGELCLRDEEREEKKGQ